MNVNVLNIIPRKFAENSSTSQYTANAVKTIIDKFTATNVSASNAVFSVYLPANGQSSEDSNLVLKSRTIPPGFCYECPELVGQALESGGFIVTLASASSSIVISATGREIS